jgi:uncharacterized repeat protein (TIGR03803 family)
MRVSVFGRYAAALCVAAASMLAGCGGSQPPIGAPAAMQEQARIPAVGLNRPARVLLRRTALRSSYGVLYSFRGAHDGANPGANLISIDGTLYGTTGAGGMGGYDYGTVFSVTASGTEKVLHRFTESDGADPRSGLVNVNGTLYGATPQGGANYVGTIFSVTTAGKERVLYNFGRNSSDGEYPTGLINAGGTLYGTTSLGGANRYGTVFSITTTGMETVLYSFGGGSDGAYPNASVINVNGVLYGTTLDGGDSRCGSSGCGTVFSVTKGRREKVLHRFSDGPDGAYPYGSLIDENGMLYGTTFHGGTSGAGTVFSVKLTGEEMVLYRFGASGGSDDGMYPLAALTDVNGTLYGTTLDGGADDYGSVFGVTTTGKENVLHSFGGGDDGANPYASLLNVKDKLYGTTFYGGGHGCEGQHASGCGTVFAINP